MALPGALDKVVGSTIRVDALVEQQTDNPKPKNIK